MLPFAANEKDDNAKGLRKTPFSQFSTRIQRASRKVKLAILGTAAVVFVIVLLRAKWNRTHSNAPVADLPMPPKIAEIADKVSTKELAELYELLEDSHSLPMQPQDFNHNYPPFVDSFNMTENQRRHIWDARADAVKRAFAHAWDGYVKFAWGHDELTHDIAYILEPIEQKGESWLHLGITVLDALDTALVLNNTEIYNKAASWIIKDQGLTMDANVNANVFETTIRVLGGLLSAYTFTKDDTMLKEAVRVAEKLMPAFEVSRTGIPLNSINLKSGHASTPGNPYSSTSEVTTIQLEFKYLTYLTGNPKYWNAVQKVSKILYQSPDDKTKPFDGLVPIYIDPASGIFQGQEFRLGSRADSYYEYLAKQYLVTNQTEPFYLAQYKYALHSGIKKHLLMRSKPNNLLYIREHIGPLNEGGGINSEKFDHLVCYIGGTLALSATRGKRVPNNVQERRKVMTGEEMEELYLAEELARSCYEIYRQTASGLSPEIVYWKKSEPESNIEIEFERTWKAFESLDKDPKYSGKIPVALESVLDCKDGEIEIDFDIHPMDKHNLLRPEAVETFFYLYRITGNEKYREWGWRVFRSFEQWTKVKTGGYTSLENINIIPPPQRDKMESFFLGETLKYFYLLFADDSILPLDRYVFNTECHPFPIFQIDDKLKTKLEWM